MAYGLKGNIVYNTNRYKYLLKYPYAVNVLLDSVSLLDTVFAIINGYVRLFLKHLPVYAY